MPRQTEQAGDFDNRVTFRDQTQHIRFACGQCGLAGIRRDWLEMAQQTTRN